MNEHTHPIRLIWIFKEVVVCAFFFIVCGLGALILYPSNRSSWYALGILLVVISLLVSISCFFKLISRIYFRWSLDDMFLVMHQGFFLKSERSVPYNMIQNIIINQGYFDKVFGLGSLTLKDASQGGVSAMNVRGYMYIPDMHERSIFGSNWYEVIGFMGNRFHIPGLTMADAVAIKEGLLAKIDERKTATNSGL